MNFWAECNANAVPERTSFFSECTSARSNARSLRWQIKCLFILAKRKKSQSNWFVSAVDTLSICSKLKRCVGQFYSRSAIRDRRDLRPLVMQIMVPISIDWASVNAALADINNMSRCGNAPYLMPKRRCCRYFVETERRAPSTCIARSPFKGLSISLISSAN